MTDEYNRFVREFLAGLHEEALAWLRGQSSEPRTLGEQQPTEQGLSLVSQLYALGADKVIALGLEPGGAWCRYLLIQLPDRHDCRAALFGFERRHAEARGLEGQSDEGQEYLFLDAKGID